MCPLWIAQVGRGRYSRRRIGRPKLHVGWREQALHSKCRLGAACRQHQHASMRLWLFCKVFLEQKFGRSSTLLRQPNRLGLSHGIVAAFRNCRRFAGATLSSTAPLSDAPGRRDGGVSAAIRSCKVCTTAKLARINRDQFPTLLFPPA
jgi:hypothetical protein